MRRSPVLFACICAAALWRGGLAAPVGEDLARTAAEAWLAGGDAPPALAGRTVASVETLASDAARLHVARLAEGGFVVLSADDLIVPVIAFSASGDTLAAEAENPLWALLTRDLACRAAGTAAVAPLRFASVGTAPAAVSRTPAQRRWDALLAPRARSVAFAASAPSVADPRVAPFVATRWNQTVVGTKNVYNYYTPNHYPCGCVATAFAQVMRHFAYPTLPVSDLDYECSVDKKSAYFKMRGGAYAWDDMPLVPTAGITDRQAQAIGALTYDIGCAVGMAWSANGSGSSAFRASLRLKDTFDYASSECVVFTDAYAENGFPYSLARCQQVVIPCLDYGTPVVMSVSGAGGHAVVVDGYGYAGDDFCLHVNCGWGGAYDAWYCPPDLTMGPYAFTAIDGFVYQILPAEEGTLVSGCVRTADGAPCAGATVELRKGSFVRATATADARGIYAVLAPETGSYTLAATAQGGGTADRTVSVVANDSRQLLDDGSFYTSARYAPTIGNTWGNDLVIDHVPPPQTETSTTSDVPVPYAWLDTYFPGQGTDAAAYEALGNAAGANGRPVWESYLLGLVPTNAAATLTAHIRLENGAPVVTWTPVSTVTEGLGYVYRVRGKRSLDESVWAPTNSATRFFKVFLEKK